MGRSNYVYEDLLKNYLAIREKIVSKDKEAREEIAKAEKNITEISGKMEAAIEEGKKDDYIQLSAKKADNEAVIKFYNGVLGKLNANQEFSEKDANEVYAKANAEINKIVAQYNEEMLKLIAPILELSNNTYAQITLLNFAKDSYKRNLLKDTSGVYRGPYDSVPLMNFVEKLVNCQPYKDLCPDYQANKLPGTLAYNWRKAANEKVAKEQSKWI